MGLATIPVETVRTDYTYRGVVERLSAGGIESALLDAACLMEAASGISRWQFILDPVQSIPHGRVYLFESLLSRRLAREPIAYILGIKEFWSLPLTVNPTVLIPRPETETVVEAALEKIGSTYKVQRSTCNVQDSRLNVQRTKYKVQSTKFKVQGSAGGCFMPAIVDLGTGCGTIALALAVEMPSARIDAIDRSLGACRVARRNIESLGLTSRVRCIQGDLLTPLRTTHVGGGYDLIVSNPPYIPSEVCGALAPEIAAYEPVEAIDGGPDGLDYYRRIVKTAPAYLRNGGWLVLEIGDGQASAVMELVRTTEGFGPAEVRQDVAGSDRVVCVPYHGVSHG